MDIFLGLLVLSGLFALFQLLLPGRSGRGIGIAQWLSWIALATALVAFLGSGRAGETFDRITGNFVDRPSPSPTISPIPIESSPTSLNPSLSPPPLTPSPDSLTSNIAIEGWNRATNTAEAFLSQLSPSPTPSPVPSPSPNPFPSPTPVPSPSPNPIPPPVPSPFPSPSPNPIPPPIPPSPTPQPPINGLW